VIDLLSPLLGFSLKFSESGFLCQSFPLGLLVICYFLQSRYFFGLAFLVLPKCLFGSLSLLPLLLIRLLVSQLLLLCDLSLPVCLLLLLLLLLLASGLLLLLLDGGLLLQLEGSFLLFLASRSRLVIGQLLQPLELCIKFFILLLLNTLSL
jgi:hypothetical protein